MDEQTAGVMPEQQPEEPYTPKEFLGDLMDLLTAVLTVVFIVMLLYAYVFCMADVKGESMEPTLNDRDRLVVLRCGREYERGDILIINSVNAYLFDGHNQLVRRDGLGEQIVKRLIAKGGQTVNIDFSAGKISVDGYYLNEPYIKDKTRSNSGAFQYPMTVPEGYLFVMGDNRNVSKDSRSPDVGLIREEAVVGRAVFRLMPFQNMGTLD